MEFIFVVGIIIAIIGALTIAAVIWQSDTRSAATSPVSMAGPSPAVEAVPVPPLPNDFLAPAEAPPSAEDDPPLTIESITALYAHANDEVAVADNALQINVANVLATQIERLYEEYVRLGEERTQLAETLLTHMLFEKIERSAGRLEITTERQTLDLREQFSRVSADYDRVQFRLGSLQHLNTRLNDPRVVEQLDEIVLEIRRLASKTP
jgi:hypothetical protein